MAEKDDFSLEMKDASKFVKSIKDDFRQIKSDAAAIASSLKTVSGFNIGGGNSGNGGFGSSNLGVGSGNLLSGGQAGFSTPLPSATGGAGTSMKTQGKVSGGNFGNGNVLETALGSLPFVGKALSGVGQIATGLGKAMPDIADTLQYSRAYYGSSVMSGFGGAMGSRKMMQEATFSAISSRGGMTSAGADAAVASLLTSRGMQFSNDPNSTYMRTVSQAATMAKYLNMPVEEAASSIEGLTSGSGASSLLRSYGIFASDPRTGKEKTMPEIFGELRSRLALGKTTQTGTMKSLRSGSLNAVMKDIESQFGTGTGDMFAQYMLDASGDGKQAMKWTTGAGLGEENPMSSIYDLNASETKQYGKAEEKYLQGLKDAVPIISGLNDAMGDLAKNVGNVNSFLQTLSGAKSVQGVAEAVGGVSKVIGGVVDALTQIKGLLPGGGDTSALGTNFSPSKSGTGGDTSSMGSGFSPSNSRSGSSYKTVTLNTGGSTSSASSAGASTAGATTTQVFRLVRPVNGRVTLGYGTKDSLHTSGHTGIDFACAQGTPVQSGADGTVVTATQSNAPNGGYGMYMEVDHGNGYKTLYAHLSGFSASVGSSVKAGQIIAKSGNTGNSTGPHLHLTLFKNGAHTDPAPFLGGSVPVSGSMSSGDTAAGTAGASGYIGASDLVSTSAAGIVSSSVSSGSAVSVSPGTSSGANSALVSSGSYAIPSSASINETGGSTELTGASLSAAGEMSLDAATFASGSGASGYSPNVTINVSVARASDEEARRLAGLVKKYIKNDAHLEKMGRF